MDRPSITNILKEQCPPGSQVVMSPSAYMTDETYLQLIPEFARGIRAMDVIKDHPDWWMTLTCDGFGSHILDKAIELFAKYKIQIVKEEGDTSQVNQSYDQDVAKKDKCYMRANLELIRRKLGKKVDQWSLIALAINAQLQVVPGDWARSHRRVNTRPSCRVSFKEWIKRLDDRGILVSGEKFFTKRTSLFDAMPACWTNLSVEHRHEVISICKGVYECAALCDDKVEWTKNIVCALARYTKLDEVHKLRACYLVALEDPSVIVHDDSTVTVNEDGTVTATATATATATGAATDTAAEALAFNNSKVRDFFHWAPQKLMGTYLKDKSDKEAQKKLFTHMTNYTAQSMWNADRNQPLEPSSHLDARMSDDQKTLLCPSYKNVLMGYILYDVKGKGAVNKLAKRRLDMISGNVASYARCLNSAKRLKQIEEVNQLVATVAEVSADIANEKEAQQVKATERKKVLKEKKASVIAKEAAERAIELPKLLPIMQDFEEGRKDIHLLNTTLFPKPYLVKILKYYYDAKPTGIAKKSKEEIYAEVMACFEASKTAVVPL